jgi:hypothetical protein
MTLDQFGNVGIGTTSPAGILDVRGGTAASGDGTDISLYAQNAQASGNHDGGNIILMPGAANGAGTPGRVGIGTASPAHTLDVAGDGNFSGPLTASNFPAPAAGDAAAGRFLKADGTWSAPLRSAPSNSIGPISGTLHLSWIQALGSGEGFFHGFDYGNGYLWALARDVSPGVLIRMLPNAPGSYVPIPCRAGGCDWFSDETRRKGYALFQAGDIIVTEVDPETLACEDVVVSSAAAYAQSMCTDGRYLYICTLEAPAHILKFDMNDWSLAGTVTLNRASTPMDQAHALRFDGTHLYVTSQASTIASTTWAIMKLSTDLNILDAAVLSVGTDYTLTDDFTFDADNVWCGSEHLGIIYRFDKLSLATQVTINPSLGVKCYGTFYDGAYVWAVFGSSPGTLLCIDPNQLSYSTALFPTGFNIPNEIAMAGDTMYFTSWTNPASICAVRAQHTRSITFVVPSAYYFQFLGDGPVTLLDAGEWWGAGFATFNKWTDAGASPALGVVYAYNGTPSPPGISGTVLVEIYCVMGPGASLHVMLGPSNPPTIEAGKITG